MRTLIIIGAQILLVLFCTCPHVRAQGVWLDPTFGMGGQVLVPSDSAQYFSNVLSLQHDGSILVGGFTLQGSPSNSPESIVVARSLSNGLLDPSFGVNGIVSLQPSTTFNNTITPTPIATGPDGRIFFGGILSSPTRGIIWAMLPNGLMDSSFGTSGFYILGNEAGTFPISLVEQTDGKLLVSTSSHLLMRLTSKGKLDLPFAENGISHFIPLTGSLSGNVISVLPSGKILVGGTWKDTREYFFLMRFLPNGIIDTTFGGDQLFSHSFEYYSEPYALMVRPTGEIILAGFSSSDGSTAKLTLLQTTSNGIIDTTFGTAGFFNDTISQPRFFCRSAALDSNGRVITVSGAGDGVSFQTMIIRFDRSGRIDSSFGMDGYITTSFGANSVGYPQVACQPDNKIVVSGSAYNGSQYLFSLERYLPSARDAVQNVEVSSQLEVYPNPAISGSVIRYELPHDERITLSVFDMLGRCVRVLCTAEIQKRGLHEIPIPYELLKRSDVYSIVLSTDLGTASCKLIRE